MKTNAKLIGFTVVAAAIMAGCTGTGLPTTTTPGAGEPGFNVRITKNNQPLNGRTVFLKKYNNVSEGNFGNSDRVSGSATKTDSNGVAFLKADPAAVTAGALFGVGYDFANAEFGGDAKNVAASNLTDEIQWFTTPAINLSTKTGKTVSVNFDVAWNVAAFQPSNGAEISGTTVTFTLPPKMGATKYEVLVNKGNAAGTGSAATGAGAGQLTSATPSITWSGVQPDTYNYQAKAFTASGVAGVGSDQLASPWSVFTVRGAQ
jgi:hypothetical protein